MGNEYPQDRSRNHSSYPHADPFKEQRFSQRAVQLDSGSGKAQFLKNDAGLTEAEAYGATNQSKRLSSGAEGVSGRQGDNSKAIPSELVLKRCQLDVRLAPFPKLLKSVADQTRFSASS
ncbi:MAG: hypothetical protein IPN42_04645 [Methylococcaceae bacterium]|nr:hypothetical protein [Methylococcaceae bacterium]